MSSVAWYETYYFRISVNSVFAFDIIFLIDAIFS